MSTQWHPLFARLLTVQLGDYYEIHPEFPVSDLPRRGDFLIVRRQEGLEPPFRGLWNHLTDWNVIEFKGPSDDAEGDDLEKLAHVGTGITYRLNEERRANKQQTLANRQVSLWYIAPTLGDTFLDAARSRSTLNYETGGLWTGRCWGHPLFLLSARNARVEEDTVPLWLIEGDPPPSAVGELVMQREDLLARYASWLVGLQPTLWEEVRAMARTKGIIDWEAVARTGEDVAEIVRFIPPEQVVKVLGLEKVIEAAGAEKALDALLTQLSPEQLQEMLKRRQQQTEPPAEGENR
jgi:hypothetical protein